MKHERMENRSGRKQTSGKVEKGTRSGDAIAEGLRNSLGQ